MNAQALRKYFRNGTMQPEKPATDFPQEAYDYDGPIDPSAVAAIQKAADKKLELQEWTVVESITDDDTK